MIACYVRSKMLFRSLLIVLVLTYSNFSFAQTDTEFWFAAPAITAGHENTPIVLRITSYDKPAKVIISQPANSSFVPIEIAIASYATVSQDLTAYLMAIETKPNGAILNTGIKITASANVSAYYEVGKQFNPEIFPLKGKNGKGVEFLIPTQTRYNNHVGDNPAAHNGFVIIASEDNTMVDITLTNPDAAAPDGTTHNANQTFQITLQKGQTYSVIGASPSSTLHLGGTLVKSNKPICITVFDDSIVVGTSWDLVGDQIVPIVNTGTEFIIVRGALSSSTYVNKDLYYIWATEDGTEIFENGSTTATININKGKSYEGVLAANSVYIKSSKPVYVLHLTGMGTEAAETSLPSIKCTGSSDVSFVRSTSETFYLNIICKSEDVNNFTLNGIPNIIASNLFEDVPGASGWKIARINKAILSSIDGLIPSGVTTTVSNSTGLFHLGFLNGGSSTGARLGYFSNYSKVSLAPNITTSSCLGGNIQLEAKKLANVNYTWSGPNGFTSTIYNPVIANATIIDSGNYFIEATILGCGTSTDSVHITINPLPTVQLKKTLDTLCYGTSKQVYFTLTGRSPWNLIFTDGIKKDTLKNVYDPNTYFTVAPKINSIFQIISIADYNACDLNATTTSVMDTLIVNPLPIANFNFSPILCEKSTITFTDISIASLDPISNWNWDMGNGVKKNGITNLAFEEVFANAGKDTVKLSVVSAMGCKSDTVAKIITIHPLPNVGFVLPKVCLDDAIAIFNDTTTSPDVATNVSYLWNFNAGNTPITNGPTYSAGQQLLKNPSVNFHAEANYAVSLKVTNSNGCVDSLTKTFTINGAIPKSVFQVLNDTILCSNQLVVIKDSSWVNFGTIGKLNIFWGDGQDTIVNDPAFLKSYSHLYSNAVSANQFNYEIQVNAFSGGKCFDDSLAKIALVIPPSSILVHSTKNYLCINDTLQLSTMVTGGVGPYKFIWETNNANASFKDSVIFGLKEGNVDVNVKVIDSKKCIYPYINQLNVSLPALPIATFIVNDTVICNGDSLTLKGAGANTYKWYNNNILIRTSNEDSLRIGAAGNYLLVVNNGQCNSLPSISIPIIDYVVPFYSIQYQLITCRNTDLIINTDAVDKYKLHFAWDFGDSTYFNLANPGTHSYQNKGNYVMQLKVTNDYCPKYEYVLVGDTVKVKDPLTPSFFTLFLLADQDTLLNPMKIDVGYNAYQWNPSTYLSDAFIANPILRPSKSITYTLTRIDPLTGCKVEDVYNMDVSNEIVVAIPKAFTPNGDNLNDLLKVAHGAGLKTFNNFILFNRFGKIVFQTNDLNTGWDGKYNGVEQEMDAYTYLVDYITYKEEHIKKTGSVLLMR